LEPRGRGRGTAYRLARSLSDLLRGSRTTDDDLVIDQEAVRLRVLTILRERGALTNADIRRLSGYGRQEVIRLMRELREGGEIVLEGRGRGAMYRPVRPASKRRRRK
jgi:ATP-dependent DNA helicase RecG